MSIVLINPFIVEAGYEQAFVKGWKATAAIFAREPGYIDTQLHESIDPNAHFRFVNIAHWATPEQWAAAMKAYPPKEGGQPGVTASPALYAPAAGGAVEAENKSVESEIRSLEDRLANAYRTSDVTFLGHLLADDYEVTDGPGTVSVKAKVLSDYRDRRIEVSDFAFDEVKVRAIAPDTAVVTGRYHWTASYDGHPIPGAFRYMRVYSRGGDLGWQVRAGQVTLVQPGR